LTTSCIALRGVISQTCDLGKLHLERSSIRLSFEVGLKGVDGPFHTVDLTVHSQVDCDTQSTGCRQTLIGP